MECVDFLVRMMGRRIISKNRRKMSGKSMSRKVRLGRERYCSLGNIRLRRVGVSEGAVW